MRRLVTRMYFPDEPANAADFALGRVEPARRGHARAPRERPERAAPWDVVLQGPGETVFFDC